ncbi:MAG: phosphonoacetaldehyde reductase [Ignavibacteriales bacterium]|nr:phosphonoacetaldehyde reductase [Ignavibacteriales bacterium]
MKLDYFGRGKINILPNLLTVWNARRILLVTGKRSFDDSPHKKELLDSLVKFEISRHKDFDINPNYEDITKGSKFVHEFDPDVIIGIGGGSVLDTAKLLSILPSNEDEILEIVKTSNGINPRQQKLILIPTTAGSGSEATHFAVCYIGKEKYSITHKTLLPDATILDSELTDSLPKSLTAISAFDALAQSIESIWAINGTTESIKYAKDALEIILNVLPVLFNDPNYESRNQILFASNLAGKAINISKTTAPHALSYGLTQNFKIPHGLAVILLLPGFIVFNANEQNEISKPKSDLKKLKYHFQIIFNLLKVPTAHAAANKLISIINAAGFSTSLRDYGIKDKTELELIADTVNKERLKNNPVIPNKNDLRKLLTDLY